ncbi:hypothetical protein FACS1894130_12140 [Spirochaetia bacterium]|nr:hypothetical protein FACS1894130_12140 [Spirochaetia bacterium]
MKTLIELVIFSEDIRLKEQSVYFRNAITDCEVEYIARGEHRHYVNGKQTILPSKYSVLYVKSTNQDYNQAIVEMIAAFGELSDYFDKIEHDTNINVSFFSDDLFSLEFSEQVMSLLSKYHWSLPISCYREGSWINAKN